MSGHEHDHEHDHRHERDGEPGTAREDSPPAACEAARAELAAELYGELDADGAGRLAAHLAGCGACRRARAELAVAARQLDAWELPEERPVARPRLAPARPRTRRAAAWLAAAAALVALLALGASGARLQARDGALTLTLHAPWRAAPADDAARADELAALEERLGRRLDARCTALAEELRAVDARRAEWSARERADRLALAGAVDRALDRERRALAGWVETFSATAARAERRTQDALFELASYVASDAP